MEEGNIKDINLFLVITPLHDAANANLYPHDNDQHESPLATLVTVHKLHNLF